MHVSIQYCYANMRSMFIEIHNRWCNIFLSGVIYHCRHDDIIKRCKYRNIAFLFPMAFMFFLALSQ